MSGNFSFTIAQGENYAFLDKLLKDRQENDNKLKKIYIQAEPKIQ
jgi:hypothetical protein